MAEFERATSAKPRFTQEEWDVRVDLAAMHRLANVYGYDDIVWNHITARVPGTDHHFLMNHFGLHNTEITASNLIKIDEHGNVLDGPPEVNTAGFVIHRGIHMTIPNALFVFHSHAPAGLAATAIRDVVHYVQDSSMLYGKIGYHDWEGLSVDTDESLRIADNLGDNKCLIMRNHGFLTVGETAGEAFMNMHYLVRACANMLQVAATGLPLAETSPAMWEKAARQYAAFVPGKYEWPALLRQIDRIDPSYKY
ncbi:Decarboxylase NovR [compost metagenome]|uniref:Ribulose-5-phosphate 4-epimerase/Fuculose-1-phosphate aldolase n=1 Tax=Pseudomonas jinjuensis TaxID=198616 RepID=A0A1H0DMA1_9PSED|nr:class II aldolase/adducin family protein [Pseudomonas jinjuensis]SDN71121.1 Ribulose-5-phosphate 4-epimerase/Fuculose-1-phosphate aldolase [Pseudomonas jinjuensis]